MRQMHKTIRHYFPSLPERFNNLTDERKRNSYEVSELLTACIAMFLLRETSRNAFNNDRKEANFKENYFKIFGKRLPHLDTVNDYLRLLDGAELEELKAALVAGLIEQKVFVRFKLLGKHYIVAIDATGTSTYSQNDEAETRLHKTSKNGKVTYYHHVLEAKLVTPSGLSISLLSEWLTNENNAEYDKQDCEQSAFKRLAKRLKAHFPRLPICIAADGLYPNEPFMNICQNNAWEYIVVLKNDSLKTLQQDIADIENKHRCQLEYSSIEVEGRMHINRVCKWIEEPLAYKGHTTYWLSCTETIIRYDENNKPLPVQKAPTTFVWISSLKVTKKNVRNLVEAGRNRWKIENEGFNTQKNGGYNLGHKFSRNDFTSYKNYYQCMQLAHLISQLTEHSSTIEKFIAEERLTIIHLWKQALGWITQGVADAAEFGDIPKCQIRLR